MRVLAMVGRQESAARADQLCAISITMDEGLQKVGQHTRGAL